MHVLSEIRQRVWSNRVGKTSSCAPKPASLPPTTESFVENTSRVHFQTCVWKHAVDQATPKMDPCDYGWEKRKETLSLEPIMLPKNISVAPDDILK